MLLRMRVVVLCLLKGPRDITGQNPEVNVEVGYPWKQGAQGERDLQWWCEGNAVTCVCSSALSRPEHTAEVRDGVQHSVATS